MRPWKTACYMMVIFSTSIVGQNSLTINIVNKSKVTLEWSRSKIFHPGTHVDIEPKIIPPGGKALITADVLAGVDLSARIFFSNSDMLRIEDFQQLRNMPSIFKMDSIKIKSVVQKKVENPQRNPEKISYIYVLMHLEDAS